MGGGKILRKLLRRISHPSLLGADIRRLTVDLQADAVRLYAAYHHKRRSSGRIYKIRKRHCRMWLPISWGETVALRRFGLFEPITFATLQRIVRPEFTVIELGACYGEFTIEISRLVGPGGRVYSFEPFPKYFDIAQRNLTLNGIANVRLMNAAAGAEGVTELPIDPSATDPYRYLDRISGLSYGERSRTATSARPPAAAVPCVSLRSFIEDERLAPDLIFMDIEGCEVAVIPDLEALLRGHGRGPIVYFELHSHYYRPGDFEHLQSLFRESGYSMQRIGGHLLCLPPESEVLARAGVGLSNGAKS